MKRASLNILLFIIVLLAISTSACGIRYHVKGQVIDEKTGEPIEGAVVAIKWYKVDWAPVYFGGSTTEIARAEDVTDEKGIFRIPKRPFRRHDMGVYKKGYICWYSKGEITFKKKPGYEPSYMEEGVNIGLYYSRKTDHKIENGMTVQLEPFKENMIESQRRKIACFANSVTTYCAPGNWCKYKKLTEIEREICYSKRWRKSK